jgi:hypothetical protein
MHDPFFIRSSTFSMNQLSLKLPFICRSEQSVNFCVVYLFKKIINLCFRETNESFQRVQD